MAALSARIKQSSSMASSVPSCVSIKIGKSHSHKESTSPTARQQFSSSHNTVHCHSTQSVASDFPSQKQDINTTQTRATPKQTGGGKASYDDADGAGYRNHLHLPQQPKSKFPSPPFKTQRPKMSEARRMTNDKENCMPRHDNTTTTTNNNNLTQRYPSSL